MNTNITINRIRDINTMLTVNLTREQRNNLIAQRARLMKDYARKGKRIESLHRGRYK